MILMEKSMNIEIKFIKNDSWYKLSIDEELNIWLTTQDGEGMWFRQVNLFNLIDKWFKENM